MWFLKYNFRPDIIFQCKDIRVYPALHTGCGHWVTISTIVLKLDEVNVYYSMRHALTDSLKRQISDILCLPIQRRRLLSNMSSFTIINLVIYLCKYCYCQSQAGPAGCKLFALVFISILAKADNPSQYIVDQ